jgi:hypothetical protein
MTANVHGLLVVSDGVLQKRRISLNRYAIHRPPGRRALSAGQQRQTLTKEKAMTSSTARTPAVPGVLVDPLRNRGVAFTTVQRMALA